MRSAITNSGLRVPAEAHHDQPRARLPAQDRPELRPAAGDVDPRGERSGRARAGGGLRVRGRAVADRRAAADPRRAGGRAGRAGTRARAARRARCARRARRRWSRASRSSPRTRWSRWQTSWRARRARRCPRLTGPTTVAVLEPPDMCDVRGHDALLPAIVVAAAGGHNLFLHGPPGTGKTMIARRVPSILPPLARGEAIEVTRIHSVAGLPRAAGSSTARPFRAPHHTISPPAWSAAAAAAAGRDHARAPRRAVPRRAAGVRAPRARGAAPATRGRARGDRRARSGCVQVPDALHARRRVEPVPVRARATGRDAAAGADRAPPAPRSAARCSTASTSPSRSAARGAAALREERAPSSARCAARVVEARERQRARFEGLGVAATPRDDDGWSASSLWATPSALRLLYEFHDRHGLSARGHSPRPARRPHGSRPRGLSTSSGPSTSPPRSRTARTPRRTGAPRDRQWA